MFFARFLLFSSPRLLTTGTLSLLYAGQFLTPHPSSGRAEGLLRSNRIIERFTPTLERVREEMNRNNVGNQRHSEKRLKKNVILKQKFGVCHISFSQPCCRWQCRFRRSRVWLRWRQLWRQHSFQLCVATCITGGPEQPDNKGLALPAADHFALGKSCRECLAKTRGLFIPLRAGLASRVKEYFIIRRIVLSYLRQ